MSENGEKDDRPNGFDPMQFCHHRFSRGTLIDAHAKLPGYRECIVCGLLFAPNGVPLTFNVSESPSRKLPCVHSPGGTLLHTEDDMWECVNCGEKVRLQ